MSHKLNPTYVGMMFIVNKVVLTMEKKLLTFFAELSRFLSSSLHISGHGFPLKYG